MSFHQQYLDRLVHICDCSGYFPESRPEKATVAGTSSFPLHLHVPSLAGGTLSEEVVEAAAEGRLLLMTLRMQLHL